MRDAAARTGGAGVRLVDIIKVLEGQHGRPRPPRVTRPFEMIVYENAAYLVDDQRRDRTWAALKKLVGKATPQAILDGDEAELIEAIKCGGMHPPMRAEKVRRAARIAMDFFDGDVDAVLKLPVKKARAALKRFPGIGDPGADKILMFNRVLPVLALESNGLRALQRLGFAPSVGGYAAQYRAMQEALEDQLRPDFDWLIGAHQLLRVHGQLVCTRSGPRCRECPLFKVCPAARTIPSKAPG